jgi:hypothetical protein
MLLTVLVSAGCGTRLDVDLGAVSETPAEREIAAGTTSGDGGGQATPPEAVTESAGVDGTPVPGGRDGDPVSSGHGDAGRDEQARTFTRETWVSEAIEVSVEPMCVSMGESVAATIAAAPQSHLTLFVSYADGRPHGQMAFASANSNGIYVWRWVVAPTVPPGEALVFAAANYHEDSRATTTEPFLVAGMEGC